MIDHNMPGVCWCGRQTFDDHRHFGVVPVEFGRSPKPRLSLGEKALMFMALISAAACLFLLAS